MRNVLCERKLSTGVTICMQRQQEDQMHSTSIVRKLLRSCMGETEPSLLHFAEAVAKELLCGVVSYKIDKVVVKGSGLCVGGVQ